MLSHVLYMITRTFAKPLGINASKDQAGHSSEHFGPVDVHSISKHNLEAMLCMVLT
jgi:hypothetical protein